MQPIGNINERFYALCLKDSGVLYEDPNIQVRVSLFQTVNFLGWMLKPFPFMHLKLPLQFAKASPRTALILESNILQIGIKAEWRAQHGRLVLFLGNKNTSPLLSVRAQILPPAHLKIELSLVPETIPPRAQVKCL